VLPTSVPPNAELVLRKADLERILNVTFSFDVHPLPGLNRGDTYDAIYYGSTDGSKYVAGVQVWRPRSPIEAQRRYSQMVGSYPNAEETSPSAVANKSFLAHWNDLWYLVFLDTSKHTVVSLTCHRARCNEPRKLVLLADQIKNRL
jgi:hypothetical protein